jgi:hypothetical protein
MSGLGYPVLPQLKETLYRFVSRLGACSPEVGADIESLVIKGDKVFVRYKVKGVSPTGTLKKGNVVSTTSLKVLSLSDGKIKEQLPAVYQIKTA